MNDDPIVEEVYRVREQLLARHGGDLRALMTDAQHRTEEAARAGRKVVALASREPQTHITRSKKAG
jgi:hypothetical protein